MAGIIQGLTASGKSYTAEVVAGLYPPLAVIRATQMTPAALFHMPPGALAHKWVAAGERSRLEDDDRAEATRALREMLASGNLSKLMPVKVAGGQIETVVIEQAGPIAFTESTTLENVFEEDANRCLLLRTDDSPEQTRRILRASAARAAGKRADGADRVRAVHHAAQLLLQERFAGCEVVIPYAEAINERFTADRVDARRHFNHLLGLVSAVALLHAFQRETRDGAVVADATDFQLAAKLAESPFRKASGVLTEAQEKFLGVVRGKYPGGAAFTTTQARELAKVSKAAMSGWLAVLDNAGLIEQTAPSKGNVPARWKCTDKPAAEAGLTVPKATDVFAATDGGFRVNAEHTDLFG